MYLTSLIHRDRLFELTKRWFADRVEPGDGRFLTEAFVYEKPISVPFVAEMFHDVHQRLRPGRVHLRRIMFKDDLRQAIIEGCLNPGPRVRELFERYTSRPEEYFPRTPVDLVLATHDDGTLVGMTRFKSIRRIADKASRRIADRLAGNIRDTARTLAERRALAAGIPMEYFYSPAEVMAQDFVEAEQIVSQNFRAPSIQLSPGDIRIDDVAGFKFIVEEDRLETVEQAISDHPRACIAEREVHRGEYNDINLLVDLRLPPTGEILNRLRDYDWTFAASRGLSPEVLRRDLPAYVEGGEKSVRAEVILTTFDELVESEFGRSIHEERIIKQRSSAPYSGRIAKNASYLIEYMLMLAVSPRLEPAPLPIKMWGRYLPDTLSAAVWELFGIEPVANHSDLAIAETALQPPASQL